MSYDVEVAEAEDEVDGLINDLLDSPETTAKLMLNEATTSIGRPVGGYFWNGYMNGIFEKSEDFEKGYLKCCEKLTTSSISCQDAQRADMGDRLPFDYGSGVFASAFDMTVREHLRGSPNCLVWMAHEGTVKWNPSCATCQILQFQAKCISKCNIGGYGPFYSEEETNSDSESMLKSFGHELDKGKLDFLYSYS